VTRRLLLGLVCALALVAPAHAGVLDATWTAPTTNTDGSALTDLGSYRVYYSTNQAQLTPCQNATLRLDVPSPTTMPAPNTTVAGHLTNLTTGATYWVAVTAVDTAGNESACSQIASAAARPDPRNGQITNVLMVYAKTADTTRPSLPGTPNIGPATKTPSGVTFPVTFAAALDPPSNTPVPRYTWTSCFNDSTGCQSGTAATNAFTLSMPYHASGLAATAFVCIQGYDEAGNIGVNPVDPTDPNACNGYTVPSRN
jgi:hypothetical protein